MATAGPPAAGVGAASWGTEPGPASRGRGIAPASRATGTVPASRSTGPCPASRGIGIRLAVGPDGNIPRPRGCGIVGVGRRRSAGSGCGSAGSAGAAVWARSGGNPSATRPGIRRGRAGFGEPASWSSGCRLVRLAIGTFLRRNGVSGPAVGGSTRGVTAAGHGDGLANSCRNRCQPALPAAQTTGRAPGRCEHSLSDCGPKRCPRARPAARLPGSTAAQRRGWPRFPLRSTLAARTGQFRPVPGLRRTCRGPCRLRPEPRPPRTPVCPGW